MLQVTADSERARGEIGSGGAARIDAEQTAGDRRHIGVDDHGVGLDPLAARKPDAARAAAVDQYLARLPAP